MKILVFIPSLINKGGVERATVNLANALSKYPNIMVTILVFNTESESSFKLSKSVDVLSLNIFDYKKQYLLVIKRIYQLLKSDYDFVITVETISLLFSFIPYLLTRNKNKLVVWEHFNFKNNNGKKIREWLRILAAKQADMVVLLTKRDQDEWLLNLSVKARISYIYNISPFENNKQIYNIGSKNIIAVGRYTQVKGFDRLINIWTIFQNKYDVLDWNLDIIGYGEDEDKLKNLISFRNVNNINLISTENIELNYSSASFCCMTSYFEGLPMVLLEAQSFGLPCVAFDIFTGPSEIIDDSTGILIQDGNLEAYADAIYALVSNPKLRDKMSFNTFEASKRFSEKVIVKRWIDELNKLAY